MSVNFPRRESKGAYPKVAAGREAPLSAAAAAAAAGSRQPARPSLLEEARCHQPHRESADPSSAGAGLSKMGFDDLGSADFKLA